MLVPSPTPSRTLSPAEQLTRLADATRAAHWESISPTVMSIFPECGNTDHREYYSNREWGVSLCDNYMTAIYNLDDTSLAWRIRYEDLFGLDFVKEHDFLASIRPIHWSSNGQFVYLSPFSTWDGGCPDYLDGDFLLRLDLNSGQVIKILKNGEGIFRDYNISFSQDDQYMAYFLVRLEHPILNIQNLITGEEQHIDLGEQFTDAGDVVWSTDLSKLVFSARTHEDCDNMTAYLVMMDLSNFSQTIVFERTDQLYYPVEWTVDNTIILSKRHSSEYYSFDLETGEMTSYLMPTPTANP